MALRFHLYNQSLGPLVIEDADPIGINEITQTVKRSEEFEGVIFEIIFDVRFIKEGRAYIKKAYETDGGIDSIVHATVYEWEPNRRRWEHYATGKVNFNRFELSEEEVSVNVEQTGLAFRITNLMEVDVDLEAPLSENGSALPSMPLKNVAYHSKHIIKQTELNPDSDNVISFEDFYTVRLQEEGNPFALGTVFYSTLDTRRAKYAEIPQTNQSGPNLIKFAEQIAFEGTNGLPSPILDASDGDKVTPNAPGTVDDYINFFNESPERIEIREAQVIAQEDAISEISVSVRAKFRVSGSTGDSISIDGVQGRSIGRVEITAWLERRGSVSNITKIGTWETTQEGESARVADFQTFTYKSSNTDVKVGDEFSVFFTVRIYGIYDAVNSDVTLTHNFTMQYDEDNTWLNISAATFSTESSHQTALMFEAVKRCCQYYSNVDDCFYSDLLGRTDLGYETDGEGSLIGLTSGNKLRSNGKHLITNLKSLLEFLDARYCIGFGFEKIGDKYMFRIEKREHFYNKNHRTISLGKVYNIKRTVLPKMYNNQVEYGYIGKIDTEQLNGIDEFNTIRRSSLPVTNAKNKLSFATRLRASGNQIEEVRRLGNTTVDHKNDDENFVVSLIRDGEGYRTKTTQGYESIDGVKFPESQYNYDLAPGRMLKEWFPFIGSSMLRSKSKLIKFSYGEVNYKLVTKKPGENPVRENGTYNLAGVEPIFDLEEYNFSCPLTRDQMKIIKANPYGYIEFFDRFDNKFEGFISTKGIEHDSTEGMAEFFLLKVNRKKIPLNFNDLPINFRPINIDDINKEDWNKMHESAAPPRSILSLIKFIGA